MAFKDASKTTNHDTQLKIKILNLLLLHIRRVCYGALEIIIIIIINPIQPTCQGQ